MANYQQPTPAMKQQWASWLSKAPKKLRLLFKQYKLDPFKLYLQKSTGKHVAFYAMHDPQNGDDVCAVVIVMAKYNPGEVDHRAFGVRLTDLVECELPEEVANP